MKPPSTDLLIKIGLAAVAIVGLMYLANRTKRNAAAALDATIAAVRDAGRQAVTWVNPADPGNIVNTAVTAVGEAVTGDPNWTLGGAIYDRVHDNPQPRTRMPYDYQNAPLTQVPGGTVYDEMGNVIY